MKIDSFPKIIDITSLIGQHIAGVRSTGIYRVNLAYVRRYRTYARALICHRVGRWICFDNAVSQQLFDALLFEGGANCTKVMAFCINIVNAYFMKWETYHNNVLFKVDYYRLETPSYSNKATRGKLKPIYFLHDLIPLSHAEYFISKTNEKHHHRLTTMINTGYGLILNSEDTRQNLIAYAEKHRLSLPKLLVAPLGVEALPKPKQQKPLQEPYFVMLGTIESRKNHLLILNVWRRLVEKKTNPMPKLILIGRRGWECEQAFDMLDRCAAIRNHVIEISNCNDEMLSTHLYHAQALLFPTFSEGYGLPLVEALSLRVPVIASDLNVFHEIAGPIPEYLDPLDGLGWLNLIENYSKEDSMMRKAQLERMQNFKATTWDDHFQLVEDFLEGLLH